MENKDQVHYEFPRKPKDIREIFQEQVETGVHQYDRPARRLFISSFAAGLEIGFSIFLMGVLYTLLYKEVPGVAMEIILAGAYPLGFIFVVIGRSELFTEHTALAVVPVLNGRIRLKRLAGLWGIIYAGNLIGGFLFSFILTWLGPAMGVLQEQAFIHLAEKMIRYDWEIILGSAILAGWLMGLLSWLLSSADAAISRILIVFIITATIGIGGLHHSIVGSIEVFSGLLVSPSVGLMDYIRVQWWMTLGNSVGGVVFVAILKFNHSKDS